MTRRPPIHRGFAERWHRARWSLTGPETIVRNPWRNGRWLMTAFTCGECGETRTTAVLFA